MEQWKDIEGYDWVYQVSSLWRVKSLKFWREKILKLWVLKYWHSVVLLCNKGINVTKSVHRMVGVYFLQNPNSYPCILHKIETLDKNWALYNWQDNLYWWTHKDNSQDMYSKWRENNHFKINHPMRWKFWANNHLSKIVVQYTKDWEFIREWVWVRYAWRSLWISYMWICACYLWKSKTSGWFVWKLKEK